VPHDEQSRSTIRGVLRCAQGDSVAPGAARLQSDARAKRQKPHAHKMGMGHPAEGRCRWRPMTMRLNYIARMKRAKGRNLKPSLYVEAESCDGL